MQGILMLAFLAAAAPPAGPALVVEGVVQSAADGRVLIGVEVDPKAAVSLPEARAHRIRTIEEAADGTLLGTTLFVSYRISGEAAARALAGSVGQRVRLELERAGTRPPVVVAVEKS